MKGWIILFFTSLALLQYAKSDSSFQWPQPYKRFAERPKNDEFCQALYPFCPSGYEAGQMPVFDRDDMLEIFAMKAPVWEFKYGKFLGYFNVMHDAIGIRSKKHGVNYTLEWYELDQLLNCTFPHLLNETLIWCNQGAACITPGIDDLHWTQNGTLVKVAEMTARQFDIFSDYVKWDNDTGIYYETWTVHDATGKNVWFEAHDCATFVINSFKMMGTIGVKFDRSVQLNYTFISLISDTPAFLGNISQIKPNQHLYREILQFYSLFQPQASKLKLLEHILLILMEVLWNKKAYLFYNYEYWQLPMMPPYLELSYTNIPLP